MLNALQLQIGHVPQEEPTDLQEVVRTVTGTSVLAGQPLRVRKAEEEEEEEDGEGGKEEKEGGGGERIRAKKKKKMEGREGWREQEGRGEGGRESGACGPRRP